MLLAAGTGNRLKPFTNDWPKSLMPIKGYALLEYWIYQLDQLNIRNVFVNIHHHKKIMEKFLKRKKFEGKIKYKYEPRLLGTGGTLLANKAFFHDKTTLFIHADNWCHCNFQDFINFHFSNRPKGTMMTMMTFKTKTPGECGIVELNAKGVVKKFHEKVENPPGNLANAAIYLLEPEILDLIQSMPDVCDFDIDILPKLLGKIATWENTDVHRDIGSIEELLNAQKDSTMSFEFEKRDSWQSDFDNNSINKELIEFNKYN